MPERESVERILFPVTPDTSSVNFPTPYKISRVPGGSSSYSGLQSGGTARFLKPAVPVGAVPGFVKAARDLQQPWVHATKETRKRALQNAPGCEVSELSADSDKLQSLVLWIDCMAWSDWCLRHR